MRILAVLFAGVTMATGATAQNAPPPSLESQLRTDYKLVKTAADAGGLVIVEPGTLLVVQKAFLGVPQGNWSACPSKYQDGNLSGPNPLCQAMLGGGGRYLQIGERVYPWKLEVNLAKDKISIGVVECDPCNGGAPSSLKGEVAFQFPKGYLATADPAKVEEVINQVLAFDPGTQAAPAQDAQTQPQQPAGAPAEPQTIEVGQTPEQVEAALGKPEKVVKLTSKQIWIYKDLKVTFVKGKVSDVQ